MSVALPLGRVSARVVDSDAPRTERIAAVELYRDFAEAEPAWRRLESEKGLTTPYQSYDFLASWHRHVGRIKEVTPLLVTAYDRAGRPVLLWPLGYADWGPLRILTFLGGKHANTNFGLWQREFAASVTEAEIQFVIDQIASSGYGIDLVALHRQPLAWDDIANPMRLLPHQPSPDDFCRRDLCGSADDRANDWPASRSRRKQLRSKSRKLASLPGYRYFRASTPAENERLLNWFFPVKATHLAAQGLSSVFAEPGIEDFVRDICHHGLARGAPLMELHAIEGDGELLALYGGTGDGCRFSSMFNTYTLGPHARYSPGLVLLTEMIAELGKRGFTSLDLGAGDADYKRGFCRETEPLLESFVPLTALGYFAAIGARAATALKRAIKGTPRLWSALQATRRHLFAPR
jgi:CelD/BcsL family acetyltransferase involved in cellulose biosynthesis